MSVLIVSLFLLSGFVLALTLSCACCFVYQVRHFRHVRCAYPVTLLLLWAIPLIVWFLHSPVSVCEGRLFQYHEPVLSDPWRCYWCTHVCKGSRIVLAGSIEEVQRVVATSAKVRVVGTGHATNSLYCNDDKTDTAALNVLLSIKRLCFMDDVNDNVFPHTVKVGAGCQISWVQRRLRSHGLHLQGFGAITEQQIGGGIMTSLHGAKSHFSLSDGMTALTAVLPNGDVHQLSRQNETFYAWPSSIGTLGVLLDVTLEVYPIRVMQCHTSRENVSQLQRDLVDDAWTAVSAQVLFPLEYFHVRRCHLTNKKWTNFTHLLEEEKRNHFYLAVYETFGLAAALLFSHLFPRVFSHAMLFDGSDSSTYELTTMLSGTGFYNPFFDQEYSVPTEHCALAIHRLRLLSSEYKYKVILRKVYANPFWLSWAYRNDICAIGTSFVDYGAPGAYARHLEFRVASEQMIRNLGGSAHAGKLWVSRSVPFWTAEQIKRFEQYRLSLDPHDKFQNQYTLERFARKTRTQEVLSQEALPQEALPQEALPQDMHTRMLSWKTLAWTVLAWTLLAGIVSNVVAYLHIYSPRMQVDPRK